MNIKKFKYESIFNILFCFSIIVSLLPVWYFNIPAMVDLPQHLGQIKILDSLFENNEFYSTHYDINWFTPYVVSNLIMIFFSKLFSPLISIKISLSIYILIVAIISRLMVELYNRPKVLQLLPIAFLYNVPFNWGFIPFLLSFSFGLIWMYLYLRSNGNVENYKHLVVSLLLAFSHAIAWGIIVFNIIVIHFYKNRLSINSLFKIIPIISPAFLIIFWSYLSVENSPSANEISSIVYYPIIHKLLILICSNLMGDDLIFGGIKLFLIYYYFRHHSKIEFKLSLFNVLLLSNVFLFFICPFIVYSTAYFGDRVAILIPTLIALTIVEINNENKLALILFVAILLSLVSRISQQYIVEPYMDGFQELTKVIKNEKRLFFITDIRDFKRYKFGVQPIPYFIHIGQILNERLDLAIDFNFSYHHNIMTKNVNEYNFNSFVNYKYPNIDWKDIDHDYIIIMDCDIDNELSDRIKSESTHLIINKVGCWSLYEREF